MLIRREEVPFLDPRLVLDHPNVKLVSSEGSSFKINIALLAAASEMLADVLKGQEESDDTVILFPDMSDTHLLQLCQFVCFGVVAAEQTSDIESFMSLFPCLGLSTSSCKIDSITDEDMFVIDESRAMILSFKSENNSSPKKNKNCIIFKTEEQVSFPTEEPEQIDDPLFDPRISLYKPIHLQYKQNKLPQRLLEVGKAVQKAKQSDKRVLRVQQVPQTIVAVNKTQVTNLPLQKPKQANKPVVRVQAAQAIVTVGRSATPDAKLPLQRVKEVDKPVVRSQQVPKNNAPKTVTPISKLWALGAYGLFKHLIWENEDGVKYWFCDDCSTKFKSPYEVVRHQCEDHADSYKKCDQCKMAVKLCDNHMVQHHLRNKNCLKVSLQCVYCGHKARDLKKFELHKRYSNHDNKCAICSQEFETFMEHKYHLNTVHDGRHLVKCNHCSEVFEDQKQKNNHCKFVNHPKVAYTYQKSKITKMSPEVEVIEGKEICKTCGGNFYSLSELATHREEVHDEDTFMCTICNNKEFRNKNSLNAHMQNHKKPIQAAEKTDEDIKSTCANSEAQQKSSVKYWARYDNIGQEEDGDWETSSAYARSLKLPLFQ